MRGPPSPETPLLQSLLPRGSRREVGGKSWRLL